MARLVLFVRCDSCSHVFDTGIRMDRRNFARATLASNYHACPACGHRGTYHKAQYIVREDAPPRDPPSSGRDGQSADRQGDSR